MDLLDIIKELRRERDRVQKAIEALEAVATGESKRRGRVGMDEAERKAVSERMRRYWQKKPFLVRQAIPGFQPFLSRAALCRLAAETSSSGLPSCERTTSAELR